jgi:DNA polymerase III alpha subunit
MIPIFKSHFSIGRSILNLEKIFEYDQDKIVLVEDSMASFRKAKKTALKAKKRFIFGLRLEVKSDGDSSKLIFFAKSNKGIDSLRRIYTKTFTEQNGVYQLNKEDLQEIEIAVPFYDSFLHKSIHNFGCFELDLPENVTFFVERNNHPFDFQIENAINKFGGKTVLVKSIFYDKKEDFKAFQFCKAICNRKIGRSPVFNRPELEECSSDEFCWESLQEYSKQ